MRRYAIGALLLDLDQPERLIAELPGVLLAPDDTERDGYVPNVVYSCGGLLHANQQRSQPADETSALRAGWASLSIANVERRPQSIHGRRAFVDDRPARFRRVGLRGLAEKISCRCGRSGSIDGTAASGVGHGLSQLGSDASRTNTEQYPPANAPTYSAGTAGCIVDSGRPGAFQH